MSISEIGGLCVFVAFVAWMAGMCVGGGLARMAKRDWITDNVRLEQEARRYENLLLDLTELLDEHPEWYDGPCRCRLCQGCSE